MRFSLFSKGDFNTKKFLEDLKQIRINEILNRYGQIGVEFLRAATPEDTGLTASMWDYEIEQDDQGYSIWFTNDNLNDGVNIAMILQFGHGTGTGGYFSGIDYINPSLGPVFEQLTDDAWNEVTRL